MDKETVYKIIGYKGEYTENVKKALKKLLKDNHPDRNGDTKIFQIINEVKKELENNKVSYKYKDNKEKKYYDDIDYNYCREMLAKLEIKKEELEKKIKINNQKIIILEKEYQEVYRNSLEMETYLLKSKAGSYLNNTKKICIVLLIIAIIVFIISLLYNNVYLLLVFALICIVFFYQTSKVFNYMQKITLNAKTNASEYVRLIRRMKKINEEKININKNITIINHDLINILNDIRFYSNILK